MVNWAITPAPAGNKKKKKKKKKQFSCKNGLSFKSFFNIFMFIKKKKKKVSAHMPVCFIRENWISWSGVVSNCRCCWAGQLFDRLKTLGGTLILKNLLMLWEIMSSEQLAVATSVRKKGLKCPSAPCCLVLWMRPLRVHFICWNCRHCLYFSLIWDASSNGNELPASVEFVQSVLCFHWPCHFIAF